LTLTLQADGKEIYHDTKRVSVLPPPVAEAMTAGTVAVFDPHGETEAFLASVGVPFSSVGSFDTLPVAAKVLIVGRDALDEPGSTSTRLAAYASEGRAVIVLDQAFPLKYQAIPAEMDLAPRTKKNEFGTAVPTADGRTAFLEDSSHRVLRD